MAKKDKERMKRGLSSLFDDNDTAEVQESAEGSGEEAEKAAPEESGQNGGRLLSVRISLIEPDRNQPRKKFDDQSLSELADNIAQVGVLQPLIVRPAKTPGRYTIVAGERRWRAARIAGLTEVPVIVKELTSSQAAQVALIENLQREDLDPVEEAKAFRRLKTTFNMTQDNIAAAVGKSRSAVANSMRLLDLEPECLEELEKGHITVGHAKVLLSNTDRETQLAMLEAVLRDGLTVRELEKLAAKPPKGKEAGPEGVHPDKIEVRTVSMSESERNLEEYRLSIREVFGVDAAFKQNASGKVTMKVSFANGEEVKEFLKRLMDK